MSLSFSRKRNERIKEEREEGKSEREQRGKEKRSLALGPASIQPTGSPRAPPGSVQHIFMGRICLRWDYSSCKHVYPVLLDLSGNGLDGFEGIWSSQCSSIDLAHSLILLLH